MNKGLFATKYGYFTEDGSEYVITDPRTPRPWAHIACNEDYGYIVSQAGGGFSWYGNSQLARMNIWHQDLIRDEMGKFIYVRDHGTKKIWSTTWKPTCVKPQGYEARYGLGYTRFTMKYSDITTTQLMFVPRHESCEIWKLSVTNDSKKVKNISLFPYVEWCLGNGTDTHREFQKTFIETRIDEKNGAVLARKREALVPGFISTGAKDAPLLGFLSCVNKKPAAYDGDKTTFLGMYGTMQAPESVKRGALRPTRQIEKWGDACAALQVDLTLKPKQTQELVFVMGRITDFSEAPKSIKKYAKKENVNKELATVVDFWKKLTDASWIDTPDKAMDFLTNKWYRYQALAGRMWAKTGYYQCSGGIGYRDQLQDSNCLLEVAPEITRKQIMVHAEQMFPDGTVFHWWHPGTGIGAHTHMTDDLLWLSLIVMNYIDETGDYGILDQEAPYVAQKGQPQEKGSIYEHCVRAFETVLSRFSPRGLPFIGEGDWNDGMSHVGLQWKGESVWLGHFLHGLLNRFAPLCERKNEKDRSSRYLERARALKAAINEHAWDGEWYIRATRDNGIPLGSKSQSRGKIFLNAQTWAVINGTATPERARIAMNSAYKYLYREYGPLLFTPGYDQIDPTIGYLSRYAPSVRENGGVYTHAACWGVQAAAVMRDCDMAYQAYRNMCPVYRSAANPDTYLAEPYVTPGNVDGPDSPLFGRGGWSWYSGSGSWMQKVAYNWICGIRASQEGLVIDPCIPAIWKGFSVKRSFRGAIYDIEIKNPARVGCGIKEIYLDNKKVESNVLPLPKGKKTYKVVVILGKKE